MAVGLLRIINGRNEPIPIVAACQQTGVGGEETKGRGGSAYNQYPKHFSFLGIGQEVLVCAYIFLYLLGNQQAQGMRLIVERVVQL